MAEKIKIMEVIGFGDLVDKYSILKMKEFRGVDFNPTELNVMKELIKENIAHSDLVLASVDLAIANANTWELESDMRKGKFNEDYESIGRTSVRIRESNGDRVKAKNALNSITGTGHTDIKVNHLSRVDK